MLHIARPVRPTADCIACHGSAATAPASLLQRYGQTGGFGWKTGEAVGAQIVSVPTTHALNVAKQAWWRHVGATLVVCAAMFVVLNRVLSRAGDTLGTLLKRADRTLYAAKDAGRNQVMCQPA